MTVLGALDEVGRDADTGVAFVFKLRLGLGQCRTGECEFETNDERDMQFHEGLLAEGPWRHVDPARCLR